MTVNLSYFAGAGWQFFDDSGVPLAGGLINTYAAGTTTPAATYTSSSGATPNANPIVLDSAGRPPSEVWLTSGVNYKFVVNNSNNVLIRTYDNIPGINDQAALVAFKADLANTSDVSKGDALVGFRQSNSSGLLTGSVGRTVHQKLQEQVSVLDFGADNSGATDCSVAVQAAISSGATSVYFPAGTYKCSVVVSLGLCPKGPPNLIGESGENTYLIPVGTGAVITMGQTNYQWHIWDIKNLAFGGDPSHNPANNIGVGIIFGHNPYESGDEYAGTCRISNCNFANLGTAIWKPYGNIGNVIEYCGFNNCNYHYRIDQVLQVIPVAMQPGNDTLYKCHFSEAETASFYFNYEYFGATIVIRDCIYEQMNGYAIQFAVTTASGTTGSYAQGLSLENVYMEACGLVAGYYSTFYGMRRIFAKNCCLINASLTQSNLYMQDCGPAQINYVDGKSFAYFENINNDTGSATASDKYVSSFFTTYNATKAVQTKPRTAIGPHYGGYNNVIYPLNSNPVGTSQTVRDGVIFPVCQEFTVAPGASVNLFITSGNPIDVSKYYVITADIKQIGVSKADEVYIGLSSIFFMRNMQDYANQTHDEWCSLANTYYPSVTGVDNLRLRIVNTTNASSVTYRFSAIQAIGFTTYYEAMAYLDSGIYAYQIQSNVTFYQSAVPTTGTWIAGDIAFNTAPASGQPKSWVCTVGGSPGTWVSQGNL